MKSFTVESILGERHETTISTPDHRAPAHDDDVISQHHSSTDELAAVQRQLSIESGLDFCCLHNQLLFYFHRCTSETKTEKLKSTTT